MSRGKVKIKGEEGKLNNKEFYLNKRILKGLYGEEGVYSNFREEDEEKKVI